jgi:DNA-directed RNA polymerase specialized sigma24 family protein
MPFAATRGLAVADRQITVLHLEGLTGAEIEAVTGIAEGAVATRLTRIRQKLRQAIRGAGDRRWPIETNWMNCGVASPLVRAPKEKTC